MESDFEEAKNLSSQGDHVEAKRLKPLKEGYHQLEVVFQDQLKELSDLKQGIICGSHICRQNSAFKLVIILLLCSIHHHQLS